VLGKIYFFGTDHNEMPVDKLLSKLHRFYWIMYCSLHFTLESEKLPLVIQSLFSRILTNLTKFSLLVAALNLLKFLAHLQRVLPYLVRYTRS